MFNVSACVWNEGAQANIVTITSKDGASGASGGSSSSSSKLGGGAIAGITVACVVVGILLAAALAVFILRKRRKWMKAGFAVAAADPEPDESVLKGPVFNSAPRSTEDGSTPMSAADVSATRSTAEHSRSAGESPAVPVAIAGAAAGTSTPELDSRNVKPDTELDGKEIRPAAQSSGVYELPGSDVAASRRGGSGQHRGAFASGAIPSSEERDGGSESPPSPFVSTMDTTWGLDEPPNANHISPTTPARHGPGPRLF